MASDALQEAMVSSGRGEPVASMAAPPTSWLSFSKAMENFLAAASSTSIEASMTSGPMPSPASMLIL